MMRVSAFFTFLSLILPMITGVETVASAGLEKDLWRFSSVDQMELVPSSILFAGSSGIRMWRTVVRDLSPIEANNRGIDGATIADCTRYAGQLIIPLQPSVIMLNAGDEDIAAGNTPERVLEDFKRFVAEVRKGLPSSPIVFMSIPPSPARWELWGKMRKANELVSKYVEGRKDLMYIDVSTPLLDRGGIVRSELFLGDRLHLNAEGYRIWTGILKPKLTELGKNIPVKKNP